jgi:glycerol-3-phosphate acyltransferase PlsY
VILFSTALAYLLGSVPVGVLACKPYGKDPRRVGSGRTGGTNVYRTAGAVPALVTVVGDTAKGLLAVWLAERLVAGEGQVLAMSLAALAAILGHNHSLFLGLKGGAGATPNLGAALALDPIVGLVSMGFGALVVLLTRYASVGTLSVSVAILALLAWRVVSAGGPYAEPALLVYAVGQLVLIGWSLRPNLARLRAGTERQLSFGRRGEPPVGVP